MKKTSTRLADGRELIYYDSRDDAVRSAQDLRPLPPTETLSELRHDPVLDEWVVVAAHRQGRTYHPSAEACPLCPSGDGRLSEIPESDYEVVVFENRFPSLAAHPHPEQVRATPPDTIRPAAGRCEVVCFTPVHDASFADLGPRQVGTVLEAWTDRTAELSTLPDVEQVFCFENRGVEIGVTLEHPHGQIYAYPFVTPRTERMIAAAVAHRARTGRNLFEDRLAAERRSGERVVLSGEHWTAFVPFAAHWPYEVHVYPHRRVSDLPALDDAEREEFAHLYLDLLRRFDLLFTPDPFTSDEAVNAVNKAPNRTPYIAAWHQAPVRRGPGGVAGAEELALHMELFTIRRTVGKLKFLAGSESGMDVFINDVAPEYAARRLREVKA
ncbi:galactose-1-phosphate uridylyltransferase [Streptacidiphilus neutrinimicus]|uniref:galactose-1-phosphate uridylyltransferase n=1 Tax=Streptacidiphilus neutrinimicus TaxID=105420 RepID=UPI0005A97FFF|nr:galactose-1-phosphate uridylyltransferase [Streptacidiphilus neutrinimicus]